MKVGDTRLWMNAAALALFFWVPTAFGFTANKVWMEFHDHGIYRVHVNYTVPALREFREAYVEFTQKKLAEAYYFDLLRGADFYLPDPAARKFKAQPLQAEPW
jgi:hypothetical protein